MRLEINTVSAVAVESATDNAVATYSYSDSAIDTESYSESDSVSKFELVAGIVATAAARSAASVDVVVVA